MINITQTSNPLHNLPRQFTPFINRKQELAELLALLADRSCSLINLVGPGGIGKTRLALEAAQTIVDCGFVILDLNTTAKPQSPTTDPKFGDGLFFVDLQPVRSAESLFAAVAEALRLALSGPHEPESQVLAYLADKTLLLLLDNVEHLLPALVAPLTNLLTAAPGVKVLVTSRTVLNMREEWVYQVPGLPYPLPQPSPHSAAPAADAATVEPGQYAAIQLFVEQAQRVRRDFVWANEQAGVIRICQLVEGIPLALELAAAWTKTLSCAVIADEIERNLEFLTSPLHNIPVQHRSLSAVFEQSWALLTVEEQQVFQQLAVFRNGFHRTAAEEVTGATLRTLSALVNHSLIYRKSDNRYQIHELLRQFAEERLVALNNEHERVQQAHSAYYIAFLQQRTAAMCGGRQQQATAEIMADYENIRTAWQWRLDQGDVTSIGQAIFALNAFYTFRGQYHEGIAVLTASIRTIRAAPATPARTLALATTLVGVGWLQIRLGQLEEAQAAFEESEMLHTTEALPPQPGLATDPRLGLGVLALTRGNYTGAIAWGEEARQRSVQTGQRANLPIAWYILAQATQAQRNDEVAAHCAQQAYAATQATQDRWFMAYCLITLGDIACTRDAYVEAAQHYQAAYELREAFADPEGMGHALYRLGMVAFRQARHTEARTLWERSLTIYQTISDRGGRAWVLNGLGMAACALGEQAIARQYLVQALHIALKIHYLPLLLDLCTSVADTLLRQGEPDFALELLVCTLRHPACGRETSNRARLLLDQWRMQLPSPLFDQATHRGQSQDLDAMTARMQTILTIPVAAPKKTVQEAGNGTSAANRLFPCRNDTKPKTQSLIEPLTGRELEVLQLLTNGLSNAEIANELVLAVGTVKFYTGQIYGKLGVRNRTQAVTQAQKLELLAAQPSNPTQPGSDWV